jgi:hypothetical protein
MRCFGEKRISLLLKNDRIILSGGNVDLGKLPFLVCH